jgi:hypothetical protein
MKWYCKDFAVSLNTSSYHIQGVHFASLLDVQNILSADTGISRQTEGHLFDNHLISGSHAIECDRSFYFALFCVLMTPVSQCPISLRAEHVT